MTNFEQVKLRYNPTFLPGDVLKIDGYPSIGLVMGSKDTGVVAEILHGKPQRTYSILFFDGSEGFVYGLDFPEWYLCKNTVKKTHLNYGEMVYGGADVQEVLFENQTLQERLGAALGAVEDLRNRMKEG